jgi:CHAT domain-containing protein
MRLRSPESDRRGRAFALLQLPASASPWSRRVGSGRAVLAAICALCAAPAIFAQVSIEGGRVDALIRNAIEATDAASESLYRSRGLSRRPIDVSDELRSMGELSKALNAVYLVTYRTDDRLRAILIDLRTDVPQIVGAYTVGSTATLRQQIARLRNSLDIPHRQVGRAPIRRGLRREIPPKSNEQWTTLSKIVGAELFPKEAARTLATAESVLIVPSAVLSSIPYGLLRPADWKTELSEKVTVSILPRLPGRTSVLQWTGLGAEDKALILVDPRLEANDGWTFPPLPGAEIEAKEIATSLHSAIRVGTDATWAVVQAHENDTAILYLATHAIADEGAALDQSFIALADRMVTPREIQSQHFPKGELVVLSACQTGLGADVDGGTIGISRAFNISGFPAVIMSLWSIDDRLTADLMKDFASRLRVQAPQYALRGASNELRRSNPNDPAVWASFEYFGVPMTGPPPSPPRR